MRAAREGAEALFGAVARAAGPALVATLGEPDASVSARALVLAWLAGDWAVPFVDSKRSLQSTNRADFVEFTQHAIDRLRLADRPLGERATRALACAGDACARLDRASIAPVLAPTLDALALAGWLGAAHEGLTALALGAQGRDVRPSNARRRAGLHVTSPAIAEQLAARALAPLLDTHAAAPRTIDPSMGSGVMLVAAGRVIARALTLPPRDVASTLLHGADLDPIAIDLGRTALLAFAGDVSVATAIDAHLALGDASIDLAHPSLRLDERAHAHAAGIDWRARFPEPFDARGGFDVVVGNPPWVAFAGRAAQPLAPELRRHYERTSAAFSGYRTLHAVFVERSAALLAPGGRLGLVVPTSMADLDGYRPARAALDARIDVDDELPDYGAHAFDEVFQPAIGLLGTRRSDGPSLEPGRAWGLAREGREPLVDAFVARMQREPTVEPSTFGERGFQSTRDDRARMSPRPEGARTVPLGAGGDVRPLALARPALFVDPAELGTRFRGVRAFADVDVLVRQTARFPIAAPSDGRPFRNSVLAAFARPPLTRASLAAYLNATPVRFLHFQRFRDARQGMPQVKIAHLRALPRPSVALCLELDALARDAVSRLAGIDTTLQAAIDRAVADAWAIEPELRRRIAAWSEGEGRLPEPRGSRIVRGAEEDTR